jgi:hypothetical protein
MRTTMAVQGYPESVSRCLRARTATLAACSFARRGLDDLALPKPPPL